MTTTTTSTYLSLVGHPESVDTDRSRDGLEYPRRSGN